VFEFIVNSTSTETVRTFIKDQEPRTVTSTFTQLLSSESVQCCFMSTETVRTLRDGEGSPRRPRRLSHSSRALPNCVGLVNLVNAELSLEEVVAGTEIPGGGGRGRLYLTLHCHHQKDSCVKMGSDESHCNVLLTVRGKVTRQRPQTTAFEEKARRAEAKSNQGPSTYQP